MQNLTLEDVVNEVVKRNGANITYGAAVDGSAITDRAVDSEFARPAWGGAASSTHAMLTWQITVAARPWALLPANQI